MNVIRQVYGQTLGLGLGQIRYSSSIIIKSTMGKGHVTWKSCEVMS